MIILQKKINAVQGMNDILTDESYRWQYLERILQELMQRYAYQEVRFPVIEKTALFKRSIGEVTDIVEKEMYSFESGRGESLSLRPEGTAVCVRMGIERGLFYNQTQHLWYMGAMFRHERPQKGRYRQFHQFGVEVFGIDNPESDAELIYLSARLWKKLGIDKLLCLQINSLGSLSAREQYREKLVQFFTQYQAQLDEDSLRRLDKNPLRILDSKNPAMQALIQQAPKLLDYLDAQSKAHFEKVCAYLDAAHIPYAINPRLVRGLDYYNDLVFEWVTDALGTQGTACAGGRYDTLVEQLGGKSTPAVGFALGLERVLELLKIAEKQIPFNAPEIVIIMLGDAARQQVLPFIERLRDTLPDLNIMCLCESGSIKSQMKRADKSMAQLALIVGEDEVSKQQFSIKFLREKAPQQQMSEEQLMLFLEQKYT